MKYNEVELFNGNSANDNNNDTSKSYSISRWYWIIVVIVMALVATIIILLYCLCLKKKMEKHLERNEIYKMVKNRRYVDCNQVDNKPMYEMENKHSQISIFDKNDTDTVYNCPSRSFMSSFE